MRVDDSHFFFFWWSSVIMCLLFFLSLSTIGRLFINTLPTLAGMGSVHINDSLCLSEYANIRVQRGATNTVSTNQITITSNTHKHDSNDLFLFSFAGVPRKVSLPCARNSIRRTYPWRRFWPHRDAQRRCGWTHSYWSAFWLYSVCSAI